jgi:NADH-quinone oxidoreductase subunit J
LAVRLGYTQLLPASQVSPQQVALSLFGPYLLGVELASMLLLAGLVGAYHLGRRRDVEERRV